MGVYKWDSDKCEMIGYQPHFYKWSWKSIFFGDSYPRRTCICVFPLDSLQYIPERKFPTLGKHPRKNLHTQNLFFQLLYHHSEMQLISRQLVYFLIFCRPKRLKVKMKGKCCDCVTWQEVDVIWCFANRFHPLLSACPLHSTVRDKKRQLVFCLDFINDHKEHDLANHVIFCIGINSLSQIILPFPCLSRK